MSIKNPKILPGPVSAILAERAWQPKPGDKFHRTRLEVVCDKLLERSEKDPKAASLLFQYIQGKAPAQMSEEQLILMLASIPHDRLAQLAQIPLVQFLAEQQKFLAPGDDGKGEG